MRLIWAFRVAALRGKLHYHEDAALDAEHNVEQHQFAIRYHQQEARKAEIALLDLGALIANSPDEKA